MGAKVQGAVLPVHPGAGDFQRLVRDLQPDIPLRYTGEDHGGLQRCDHISGTAGLLCCQKKMQVIYADVPGRRFMNDLFRTKNETKTRSLSPALSSISERFA